MRDLGGGTSSRVVLARDVAWASKRGSCNTEVVLKILDHGRGDAGRQVSTESV